MPVQTTPLEVRLTDPHAFRVSTKGGTPVFEVDTLTLAAALSGRFSAQRFVSYRNGDAVEFSDPIRIDPSDSGLIIEGREEGEAGPKLRVLTTGIGFGPGGSNFPDTYWYRRSASAWETPDQVYLTWSGAALIGELTGNTRFQLTTNPPRIDVIGSVPGAIYRGLIDAEANPRMQLQHDRLEFGAGGGSALDVNLYRSAANLLATADAFEIALHLAMVEQGADPANVANQALLYSKDDGGVTKMYYRMSDGTVVGPLTDVGALHAPVTLGGGSDPALALVGQQLTLADVLTPAEHTAIGAAAPHHAQLHGAADHNVAVLMAGANENLGAFYIDIDDIVVPANPAATVRRVFVDNATGQLSVRTAAGVTVSLEAGGVHNLLDGATHPDTVAQACSRGSLIYGTSGLQWDELIVGAIGTFLRADGADVYYGTILDADIPAIHSGTAHHAIYTNAMAVAAIEAEDPLDLAGVVALAKYLEFDEIAAPGAGAANVGRLYSVDRGGLTTLEWVDSGGVTADISHAPCARVYHTGVLLIVHNTVTTIPFNNERFDTDSIHSVAVNTSRLTATTAGKYSITAQAMWDSNAVGRRAILIRHSSGTVIAQEEWDTNQNFNTYMNVTTLYHLAAAEYVEMQVYQSSGGGLNVTLAVAVSPEFMMHWVAP